MASWVTGSTSLVNWKDVPMEVEEGTPEHYPYHEKINIFLNELIRLEGQGVKLTLSGLIDSLQTAFKQLSYEDRLNLSLEIRIRIFNIVISCLIDFGNRNIHYDKYVQLVEVLNFPEDHLVWKKVAKTYFIDLVKGSRLLPHQISRALDEYAGLLTLNKEQYRHESSVSVKFCETFNDIYLHLVFQLIDKVSCHQDKLDLLRIAFQNVGRICFNGQLVITLTDFLSSEKDCDHIADFVIVLYPSIKNECEILYLFLNILSEKTIGYTHQLPKGVKIEGLKAFLKVIQNIPKCDRLELNNESEYQKIMSELLLFSLYFAEDENHDYSEIVNSCREIAGLVQVNNRWENRFKLDIVTLSSHRGAYLLDFKRLIEAATEVLGLNVLEARVKKISLELSISQSIRNDGISNTVFRHTIDQLKDQVFNINQLKAIRGALVSYIDLSMCSIPSIYTEIETLEENSEILREAPEIFEKFMLNMMKDSSIQYDLIMKLGSCLLKNIHNQESINYLSISIKQFLAYPIELNNIIALYDQANEEVTGGDLYTVNRYKSGFDSLVRSLMDRFQIIPEVREIINEKINHHWIRALSKLIIKGCHGGWSTKFIPKKGNYQKRFHITRPLCHEFLKKRVSFDVIKTELLLCIQQLYSSIQDKEIQRKTYQELKNLVNVRLNFMDPYEIYVLYPSEDNSNRFDRMDLDNVNKVVLPVKKLNKMVLFRGYINPQQVAPFAEYPEKMIAET